MMTTLCRPAQVPTRRITNAVHPADHSGNAHEFSQSASNFRVRSTGLKPTQGQGPIHRIGGGDGSCATATSCNAA